MPAERLKEVNGVEGDIALGSVAPANMPVIFSSIDLGVLPFEKTHFTDHALPIKLIEYGAARKCVLATDLIGVRELGLPYVHIVKRSEDHWVRVFEKIRNITWSNRYDESLRPFDWEVISQQVEALF